MTIVEGLWTALLAMIVLLLPLVVVGLHRLWAASRNIEYYFREMVKATEGIVSSTANLEGLNDTIAVSGKLLSSGGSIRDNAATIRELLTSRTGKRG